MMRRFALLLVLALAGCTGVDDGDGFEPPTNVATYVPVSGLSAPPTAAPTEAPTPPTPVMRDLSLREVARGHARMIEPGRLAITDAGTWNATWSLLHGEDVPPLPAVDFARETVLLALHGYGPDACRDIRVTNATYDGREVRAVVVRYEPGPSQVCADVVVTPWHAVAVEVAEARVAWDERTGAYPPA